MNFTAADVCNQWGAKWGNLASEVPFARLCVQTVYITLCYKQGCRGRAYKWQGGKAAACVWRCTCKHLYNSIRCSSRW